MLNNLLTSLSKRWKFIFLLACMLFVYCVSYAYRYNSYLTWLETPDKYVVEGVTAMSGMDSYYWLKMARELDEGNLGQGQRMFTKNYPDGGLLAYKDRPGLLARLISFGKNFTGGDYYRSGLLLIPLLSGLFVFPLFFYFHRIGLGVTAIMGGLIGTFSGSYYARTKIGRVDTDLLNLFFPLAIACFILPLNRERSWQGNLGLAAGAGLMMNLYVAWYQQPSFIGIYLAVIAVYLLLMRVSRQQLVPILLVYLFFCGPENALEIIQSVQTFLTAYIAPPQAGGGIVWPNVMQTIGEAQARGITYGLKTLHEFLPLVIVGFAGMGYLCIRHFKQIIPFAPMLVLGAWSLIGPSRFAMYLAPFVGIGVGTLIALGTNSAYRKFGVQKVRPVFISAGLIFVIFFASTAYTGFPETPVPRLNAPTTRALLEIKQKVPQNAAMFTSSWEYGYPLMEIVDFATYHDGGTQLGIRGALTARAMTSEKQQEMVSLIAYLEDHGFNQLATKIRKEKLSAEDMLDLVFDYPRELSGDNVYIIYLEEMIWKVYSTTKLGSWDFIKRSSEPTDYVELHCFAMRDNVMQCSDGTIDLNRGFMNDGSVDIPMRGALFVDDGNVINERYYEHDSGYYLQVLMKNGQAFLTLVADGPLFRSNFNQQFLLGKYDRRYFEEVYNNYPVARVFKVKSQSSSEAHDQP